ATLKPSHLLQPAARHMGRIVVADIGIEAESRLVAVGRPKLATPGPDDHKYSRGYVLVVAGEMPGAAALAASAALQGGAGYVCLAGEAGEVPHAVVRRPAAALADLLRDGRIGAVVVGPGLGRGPAAWETLEQVMAAPHPVVLDGDAFALIAAHGWPWQRRAVTFATPHAGEFEAAFGNTGSKIVAARAAAARAGALLVYKGPDTVVAAPGGRAAIHAASTHWLATAGTGDVLAGLLAARVAARTEPFDAACAAVWLHARAAELAGAGFIADDLLDHLPAALAECL
ncbi:MAG: ADP-dependent NAD(P)H-hydrate dehydratase / NAD(P)H-hydrate epimerase, partial [Sphingomonadales bacterium]|nr:ADP-dependent NAD(P)H-hydrate dehydratase / NAD(P)H-hydrate epimerase [Sphingomonadales bacterium]